MKYGLSKLLAVLMIFLLFKNDSAFATPRPNLEASSAILMDVATGKVLLAKNSSERRAPASTTKILTALVALERGDEPGDN